MTHRSKRAGFDKNFQDFQSKNIVKAVARATEACRLERTERCHKREATQLHRRMSQT
jgi:hypothetical protein